VMSQGSMPPAHTAADISRSPLLPSSRMTATRTCVVGGWRAWCAQCRAVSCTCACSDACQCHTRAHAYTVGATHRHVCVCARA
jgi:hypothetical protein